MTPLLAFEGDAARVFAHLGGDAYPARRSEPAKGRDLRCARLVVRVADRHRASSLGHVGPSATRSGAGASSGERDDRFALRLGLGRLLALHEERAGMSDEMEIGYARLDATFEGKAA
jgi:hypothetical protein